MKYSPSRLVLISTFLIALASIPALAFDPNAGASEARTPAMYQPRLPAHVVPPRYYESAPAAAPTVNAPVAAAAPVYAPTPVVTYAQPEPAVTGTIAPLPVLTEPAYAAPMAAIEAPAPVYTAPVAAAQVPAPAPLPNVVRVPENYAPAQRTAPSNTSRFTFGIEGFYDEYQEDTVSLVDEGYFAGITAGYEVAFTPEWSGAIEFRAARGSTDYESVSGTIDDISQWDTETRLLAGYSPTYYQQGRTKFYAGLGTRYFSDELKGKVASLGASGYDRRIFQIYLPIGLTYEFAAYGLTFTPNVEYDQLLWGNVSSRLGTLGGAFRNIENEQTEGYGLRGELMMGQVDASGRGWQFGPFVRYWDIPDSEVDGGFIEPENTRLQAGVGAKFLF